MLLSTEMQIGKIYHLKVIDCELGTQQTLEEAKEEDLIIDVYGRFKAETDSLYIFAVIEYPKYGTFDPFKIPKGTVIEVYELIAKN